VVYSQTGLGMGIAFSDMDPAQRSSLDTWLAELTGEKQALHHHESAYADSHGTATRPGDKTALVRLVRLMITKGLLTEAEGASVLIDPVL
jgi:hypothetical protein